MERSLSGMLIETVVKHALKTIKEDPERGVRNLVDLAAQFSGGDAQKRFFSAAQAMLQKENSAYYGLIRDVAAYTDEARLYTFGMNLGYHGCTVGARRIRERERELRCGIPWAVILDIDPDCFEKNRQTYHRAIQDGESLGIYVWMLFAERAPETVLSAPEEHPDSAFCIFCQPEAFTPPFLDQAAELCNMMPVVRYDENAGEIFDTLRKRGFLYSVWYPYGPKDVESITSGDLFSSTQQAGPVFTVLLPEPSCPEPVKELVYQTVAQTRGEQSCRTVPWELQADLRLVDAIISDEACCVCFDKNGDVRAWDQRIDCACRSLFQGTLAEILMSGYPRNPEPRPPREAE